MFILKYAISNTNIKQESDWIIVLDNASIHHSSHALKTKNDIRFNMMFLLVYSPSLVPVELLFRMIKTEMSNQFILRIFDLINPWTSKSNWDYNN